MASRTWFARSKGRLRLAPAGAAVLLGLSACQVPFNLGQPTTRELEAGATASLSTASAFEMSGTYTEGGTAWTADVQLVRPDRRHLTVTSPGVQLEAIVVGDAAYFRGQQFLAQHMGADPISRSLVQAAGSAWWKGDAATLPKLPDLTDGSAFAATFLGSVVTQRLDHVSVGGIDAVDLAGPRADVYISAAPPYPLLRLHLKKGATVDGVSDADLHFTNFNRDFQIVAPPDVIDFSNLSTLPPVYTVVSVDGSGCVTPCVVAATLKNLGGASGAKAPSTVTFTLTDPASGAVIGTCQAEVVPDVGYNGTTAVSCTIAATGAQPANAALVTAVVSNPGRG